MRSVELYQLLEGQGTRIGVSKWIAESTGSHLFQGRDIEGAIAELKAKQVKLQSELRAPAMRLEDCVPDPLRPETSS
jgi:hypothetical protein